MFKVYGDWIMSEAEKSLSLALLWGEEDLTYREVSFGCQILARVNNLSDAFGRSMARVYWGALKKAKPYEYAQSPDWLLTDMLSDAIEAQREQVAA